MNRWLAIAMVGAACVMAVLVVIGWPRLPSGPVELPQRLARPLQVTPAAEYQVNAPDDALELDIGLQEISGLSAAKDGQSLWVVDDERPTLFRISTATGKIVEQLELRQQGDYESVEAVGDRVWVARSDGVLLVVDPSGRQPIERVTVMTEVGLACELEGTAYQPQHERLLMSCKNEVSKTRASNLGLVIFGLDLQTRKVGPAPVFAVGRKTIEDYLTSHADVPGMTLLKGQRFAASGLAVHPVTGEVYVLSTRGKMVLVLARDGSIARVEPLDRQLHQQPEGIAFTADATLYISNEAHGRRPATLYRYRRAARR